MKQIVIIGAGGFGREVLDVIDAINEDKPQYEALGFVVDSQYGSAGTIINGKPILGDFDWLQKYAEKVQVVCGVGPPHQRYHLVQRAKSIGCAFISLIHPTAIVTRWVQIGQGVLITAGCILTNQICIGDHAQINLACTIGHDVILKDFVTLAPGVHVSGNVSLDEGAYVGTGANLVEKIKIGHWSIVGAGSVVIKDVPANTTIVGNPTRIIKERQERWYILS